MKKYKQLQEQKPAFFIWRPVTEKPEDLGQPVIFLTDRGAMVTHKTLLTKEGRSLFGRHFSCNAIAWTYQKDLIPNTLEKEDD